MPDCNNPRDPFIGSGRLRQGGFSATPNQTFNAHLGGDANLRHCASHINMSPPLPAPYTADDVQTTLELLAADDGYNWYVTVGDGYVSTGDFNGTDGIDQALSFAASSYFSEIYIVVFPGNYNITTNASGSTRAKLFGLYDGTSSNLPEVRINTGSTDVLGRPKLSINSAENIKFISNSGDPFSCVNVDLVNLSSDSKLDILFKNCIFQDSGLLFNGQRSTQYNSLSLSVDSCTFIHTQDFWSNTTQNISFLCNTVPDNVNIKNSNFLGFGYSVGIGSHASLPVSVSSSSQNINIENCSFNTYLYENSFDDLIAGNSIVSGNNYYIWVNSTAANLKIINSKIKGVAQTITGNSSVYGMSVANARFISLIAKNIFVSENEILGPMTQPLAGPSGVQIATPTLYLTPQSACKIINNIISGGLPINATGTTIFSNQDINNSTNVASGIEISHNTISAYKSSLINNYSSTLVSVDSPFRSNQISVKFTNNDVKNYSAPSIAIFPLLESISSSTYTTQACVQINVNTADVTVNGNNIKYESYASAYFAIPHYTNMSNQSALSVNNYALISNEPGIKITENNITYDATTYNAGTLSNKNFVIQVYSRSGIIISNNPLYYNAALSFTTESGRYMIGAYTEALSTNRRPLIISGNTFTRSNSIGAIVSRASENAWIFFNNVTDGIISGNILSNDKPNDIGVYATFEDTYRVYYTNLVDEIRCENNKNQTELTYIRMEYSPGDFSYFTYNNPGYPPGQTSLSITATEPPAGVPFNIVCWPTDLLNDGYGRNSVRISGAANAGPSNFRFRHYLNKYLPPNVYITNINATLQKAAAAYSGGSFNFRVFSANGGPSTSSTTTGDVLLSQTTINIASAPTTVLTVFALNLAEKTTADRIYVNMDFTSLQRNGSAVNGDIYMSSLGVIYHY
jgi:hypothetical protein